MAIAPPSAGPNVPEQPGRSRMPDRVLELSRISAHLMGGADIRDHGSAGVWWRLMMWVMARVTPTMARAARARKVIASAWADTWRNAPNACPCSAAGRRFEDLEVSITPRGRVDLDTVKRFAEMGVSRLILLHRGRDENGVLDFVRQTERDLISKL